MSYYTDGCLFLNVIKRISTFLLIDLIFIKNQNSQHNSEISTPLARLGVPQGIVY